MAAGTSAARTAGEAGPGVALEAEDDEGEGWEAVLGLPCELTVDLPLPGFKITDFLQLRAGSVIDAMWRLDHDVPLRLNGTLIGWVEFEAVANHLAVRLTELA